METDTQQLDPQAVNLTKAIRQVETGSNFQATGKSGEYGAYQFTPSTWTTASQKYLGQSVPLEKSTPSQQTEVVYKQIKDWKDQGYNPGQIASMWNAGEKNPNAYLDTSFQGTNKSGAKYNVSAYAKSVANAYQTIKGGGQVNGDPNNPSNVPNQFVNPGQQNQESQSDFVTPPPLSGTPTPPPDITPTTNDSQNQGLGSELIQRSKDLSNAVENPNINIGSKVIQGAGAIAGAGGDIINAGLNAVTFGLFNKVTGLVGKGVEAVAQTPIGQSILKSVQDFSQAHPELSADIGAGVNIATAIPILKGVGLVKDVAMDAASNALKNMAEKAATKEFTEVAMRTVGGRKLINTIPDGISTLVKERAIPDVENVGGRTLFNVDEAQGVIKNSVNAIDEKELQPILEEVSKRQNFGQSLATLKSVAIKEAENDVTLKEAGMVPKAIKQIESRFEGWQHSYGENVDLATENRLKIGSGKFSDWGTPEGSADKVIYRALQKNIEDVAQKNGLGDVRAINQKMAKLLQAQKLLDVIKGKPMKGGFIHGLVKNTATVGGEMAGNAVGVPFAGALVGRGSGGLIEKTLGKVTPRAIRNSVLQRTTEGYISPGVKGLIKGGKNLIGVGLINRANR